MEKSNGQHDSSPGHNRYQSVGMSVYMHQNIILLQNCRSLVVRVTEPLYDDYYAIFIIGWKLTADLGVLASVVPFSTTPRNNATLPSNRN